MFHLEGMGIFLLHNSFCGGPVMAYDTLDIFFMHSRIIILTCEQAIRMNDIFDNRDIIVSIYHSNASGIVPPHFIHDKKVMENRHIFVVAHTSNTNNTAHTLPLSGMP